MSDLPPDVLEAGEEFVESVSFPWGEVDTAIHVYESEATFWQSLARQWRARLENAEAWPHKTDNRAETYRVRYGETNNPHHRLDWKLYRLAHKHATE